MPQLTFGAVLPGTAGLFDEARLVESLGFDAAFFAEHHQQPRGGWHSAPLTTCALVAGATTRLKVGTGILLLPLYHPITVAEEGATIDNLSGGRLIMGFGLGYQPIDFAAFGVSMAERVARLEEGIEVVRQAWTEGRVSFQGKRYQLEDVVVTPRPAQQPRPPIWLAGWSEPGVRRAARLADAWIVDPVQRTEAIQAMGAIYREECVKLGKTPRIALMRNVLIADSKEQAAEFYAGSTAASFRYYWEQNAFNPDYDPWAASIESADQIAFEEIARGRLLMGSPEECADQIAELVEATGADYLAVAFMRRRGARGADALAPLRRFGGRVLPRFG